MAGRRKTRKSALAEGGLFPELNVARYGDNRRKQPLILPKLLVNEQQNRPPADDQERQAHEVVVRWANLETSSKLRHMGEQDLKPEFLTEVFGKVLRYILFSEDLDHWELRPRYPLPSGQEADGAIGLFRKEGSQPPVALIELKGPTVNLDRDKFSGRTPVQQCWDYLYEVPECPWGIVCNYVSLRLYHRNETPNSYELFTLQELREDKRFRQFLALFEREGLLAAVLGQEPRALRMLRQSKERQRTVGKELYREYHRNREDLIAHLRGPAHGKSLDAAIGIAQTLLGRIIFIAFCEDRELLPARVIKEAYEKIPPFARVRNPKWRNFLDLFRSVDEGNEDRRISPFDGRLFEANPEVDDLDLDDRWTDFFHAVSTYDFRDEVNVDVLGHLFEQSITDLEALRADPERLEKPRKVSGRRKREGIYYTPKHITRHIVEQTLGSCIEERFAAIAATHKVDPHSAPDKKSRNAWLACREEMLDALRGLRVCDPACGSGAFLIQAYDYLEDQYADVVRGLAEYGEREEGELLADARRSILRENLFGVDLSGEAVDIARLALWIRTAEVGKTLANLSENIQCGNSIVDDPAVDRNGFDWQSRFQRVFEEGGFDCVISNPPYVKLQNFRKRHPKIAADLVGRYRSARTGNFDMYLPFIERGLELLKPGGRLGFIAPSVWIYNEYGRGMRELVLENRFLERFVDFKSFQVFEDATNYTALQFFQKRPCEAIAASDAPDGEPAGHPAYRVTYQGLSSGAWAFMPPGARRVLDRMRERGLPLGAASKQIFQGLITSSDAVYHLFKLGPGRYYSRSLGKEVELEDEIMKPLVSGEQAEPFAVPETDVYILFPYHISPEERRLLTVEEMAGFKRAWTYLLRNQTVLRQRERGKFDDDRWYRFGRTQNIDKQHLPKLLVPRLLLTLFASFDPRGRRCIDNVDVGGITAARGWDLAFLLGVLNSNACGYAWRLTSKPFRGDYRSANKQFIAPLPIPNVKPKDQKPVAGIARKLADLHGKRLEAFAKVRRRIIVDLSPPALVQVSPLPRKLSRKLERFAEIPIAEALKELGKFAKRKLGTSERGKWDSYLTKESNAIARISRRIEDLTGELNDRVNALYGLTGEQVKVIRGAV